MAEVVFLEPNQEMPDPGDYGRWITVEASGDGRFFGTGYAVRPTGENVYYLSLPENDHDLETALAAAQAWSARFDVPTIWVQLAF